MTYTFPAGFPSTQIEQNQLPHIRAVPSPSLYDNDLLTAWLVESMRMERCEIARILKARHSKLVAEWSRIRWQVRRTSLEDTSLEDKAPPAMTISRVRAPTTPRVNAQTTSKDDTFNDIPQEKKQHEVALENFVPQQQPVWQDEISQVPNSSRILNGNDRYATVSSQHSIVELDSAPSTNHQRSDITGMTVTCQDARDEAFVNAVQQHGLRRGSSAALRIGRDCAVDRLNAGKAYFSFDAFECFVASPHFESAFGFLIVLSSLVLAVQIQCEGFQTCYEEQFPSCQDPSATMWPGIAKVLTVVQLVFGICFVTEVLLKVVGLRRAFPKSFWNWFDTVVSITWCLSEVGVNTVTDPETLRLLRITRLVRLLRLVRTFAVFDVLHLLIGSIRASVVVLFWSLLCLFSLMLLGGLLLNSVLSGYISADDSSKEYRYKVWVCFGTFTRSMVTMWEITLGNWVPVCRLLMERVSEWFALFFLLWQGIFGFAVITTIRGVFMHETFKVADSEENLMIIKKQQMLRQTKHYMLAFFEQADTSHDGFISHDEFLALSSDPKMEAWLAAMDMDITDVEEVFTMMDDGDGRISVDELLAGFSRLRGAARSLDICQLTHKANRIENAVDRLHALVDGGCSMPKSMYSTKSHSAVPSHGIGTMDTR